MDASTLRPMLASPGTVESMSFGPWAYECKWDGARAIVQRTATGVRAFSRRGNDVTAAFPELARLQDGLPLGAVLDGEVVAFDEQRRPSFEVLQRRLNRRAAPGAALLRQVPVALIAFDLLHDGRSSLLDAPYTIRRQALDDLGIAGPSCQVPAAIDELPTALRVVGDLGLEGIVAKRPGSAYRPGERSDAWRKLRLKLEQEFVVGGHRPGRGGRGAVGSLLLGVYDDDGNLRHAGSVGSGISDRELAELHELLTAARRTTSPFADEVPHDDAIFCAPRLVVQIRFAEWTNEGYLRQPTYRGRRTDKDPFDVRREQ